MCVSEVEEWNFLTRTQNQTDLGYVVVLLIHELSSRACTDTACTAGNIKFGGLAPNYVSNTFLTIMVGYCACSWVEILTNFNLAVGVHTSELIPC